MKFILFTIVIIPLLLLSCQNNDLHFKLNGQSVTIHNATPLMKAVYDQDITMISSLVQNGTDLNESREYERAELNGQIITSGQANVMDLEYIELMSTGNREIFNFLQAHGARGPSFEVFGMHR